MINNKITDDIKSSFRDPSGFVFIQDGRIYRQINMSYKDNYDHLLKSGLYDDLIKEKLLIPHNEINQKSAQERNAYKIIRPECIYFISYPYEWSFTQLKHAALITLKIQKRAMNYGMSLKDCSAYNIQFLQGKPILIDTLSFEKYNKNKPWVAYKQFCQHFVAPLSLMCYKDIRLSQLLRVFIDGIPLDLASSLLPLKTKFKFNILTHIHLHAKSQKYFAKKSSKITNKQMGLYGFLGLIDSLENTVRKMEWKAENTEWADYYKETNYSESTFRQKIAIVSEYISESNPKSVWDIGSNIGVFSRISSNKDVQTISFDIDPGAVEKNYLSTIKNSETHLLPLLLDLTNPSPGIGWENSERISLLMRGPADTLLALAIIHHLAIANNVPLLRIAEFFSKLCTYLIIEFIPKEDSQVKKLLRTREDIFLNYSKNDFERDFSKYFKIQKSVRLNDSKRIIYLMKRLL